MNDTTAGDPAASVLTVGQIGFDDAATLLAGFGLRLHRVAAGKKIPGSYWGEPEAGIIAANVYIAHREAVLARRAATHAPVEGAKPGE